MRVLRVARVKSVSKEAMEIRMSTPSTCPIHMRDAPGQELVYAPGDFLTGSSTLDNLDQRTVTCEPRREHWLWFLQC
jgi:hypothetical protein